jgi:hypothetical protein
MTGFAFLDLIIGVSFVYLILSVFCSTLYEIIAGFLNFRSNIMEEWVRTSFPEDVPPPPTPASPPVPPVTAPTLGDGTTVNPQITDAVASPTPPAPTVSTPVPAPAAPAAPPRKRTWRDWFYSLMWPLSKHTNDNSLANQILSHETFSNIKGNGRLPDNISASDFARVMIDRITVDPNNPGATYSSLNDIKQAVNQSGHITNDMRRMLLQFVANTENVMSNALNTANNDINAIDGSIQHFLGQVEFWFNNSMEKLTLVYRQKARVFNGIFALFITIATNADTIRISTYLYNHPTQAATMATMADAATKQNTLILEMVKADTAKFQYNKNPHALDSALAFTVRSIQSMKELANSVDLNFPLGWNCSKPKDANGSCCNPKDSTAKPNGKTAGTPAAPNSGNTTMWASDNGKENLVTRILGLILTFMCVTLGAPFWFDTIKNLLGIRKSVSGK